MSKSIFRIMAAVVLCAASTHAYSQEKSDVAAAADARKGFDDGVMNGLPSVETHPELFFGGYQRFPSKKTARNFFPARFLRYPAAKNGRTVGKGPISKELIEVMARALELTYRHGLKNSEAYELAELKRKEWSRESLSKEENIRIIELENRRWNNLEHGYLTTPEIKELAELAVRENGGQSLSKQESVRVRQLRFMLRGAPGYELDTAQELSELVKKDIKELNRREESDYINWIHQQVESALGITKPE